MAIRVSKGAYGTPILGKGRSYGPAMVPFERAMVVSYKLSIVTVALSVGRNLRSNVSDAQINNVGPKFRGVPLGVNPSCWGSAYSKHPRLTNGEIIFEEFQPMFSQSTNVTDRQTDGQTDKRWQYRALHCKCVMHRALKTDP